MKLGRTSSVALLGMTGTIVEVEANISSQLPGLVIIGLPDTALSQASHRVRAAASNSGHAALGPPHHGEPVAGVAAEARLRASTWPSRWPCLAAAGGIEQESLERVVHLGELALDGRLRPIAGVLPAVAAARAAGRTRVMVPTACVEEAELVPGHAGDRRREPA